MRRNRTNQSFLHDIDHIYRPHKYHDLSFEVNERCTLVQAITGDLIGFVLFFPFPSTTNEMFSLFFPISDAGQPNKVAMSQSCSDGASGKVTDAFDLIIDTEK